MPKTSPAEWLLARLTDRDRAAAILGDLEEISTTRGRLWFVAAYARTLITLGWRTPVAFVAGFAGFWLMMSRLSVWLRIPASIKTAHMPHGTIPATLAVPSTGFLMIFSMALWFALPYAIVRFGHRDRMAQLYFAFFLLTTPFFFLRGSFSLSGSISPIFALLTITLILAALFSPLWRKPMMVLAATSVTAIAALEAGTDIATKIYHPHFHSPLEFNLTSWIVVRLTCVGAFAVTALVCTYLHRRLLRQRPAIA
jgi:hypothetical protein